MLVSALLVAVLLHAFGNVEPADDNFFENVDSANKDAESPPTEAIDEDVPGNEEPATEEIDEGTLANSSKEDVSGLITEEPSEDSQMEEESVEGTSDGYPQRYSPYSYSETESTLQSEEVCEHADSPMTITCDGRILIETATYGVYSNNNTCNVEYNKEDSACIADKSLEIVKAECDGKSTCSLIAENKVFGDPCRGTNKYLVVTWYCVQGCTEGYYFDSKDEVCQECANGTYNEGGWLDSCANCPDGKTSTAGTAASAEDCRFKWNEKNGSTSVDLGRFGLQIMARSDAEDEDVISISTNAANYLYWNSQSILVETGGEICFEREYEGGPMSGSVWTLYLVGNRIRLDYNDISVIELEEYDGECRFGYTDNVFDGSFGMDDSASLYYRQTEVELPEAPTTEEPATTQPATETPTFSGDMAVLQVCEEPRFENCTRVMIFDLGEKIALNHRIRSIRWINYEAVAEAKAFLLVESDIGKQYEVRDRLIDADLTDGTSMAGFYLEADGGTTITSIMYKHEEEEEPVEARNIERLGRATQSDTVFDGAASRAIDGNTDGYWDQGGYGSITHTNNTSDDGAWWRLSWDIPMFIDTIMLYNRQDECCTARLDGATVRINGRTVGRVNYSSNEPFYTFRNLSEVATEIEVRGAPNEYLSLAEVEVFGREADEEVSEEPATTGPEVTITETPSLPQNIPTVKTKEAEVVIPTEIPTDAPEEVIKLVENNVINFTVPETPDDGTDDGNQSDAITIKMYTPKFNGAYIPFVKAMEKAKEYEKDRSQPNLLGYFAENGYLNYGLDKTNNQRKQRNEAEEVAVTEDVMVASIKSYQKKNGFPETGSLTEAQVAVMSQGRCGNPDADFAGESATWTCLEGTPFETEREGMSQKDEGNAPVQCPDPSDKLDICSIYPSALEMEDYKDFVWKQAYYFEADIEYMNKRVDRSHVAIAFNFNRKKGSADYVYIKADNINKRLCFSRGKYTNGSRTYIDSAPGCRKFTHDETALRQFKIRLTVKGSRAILYVSGAKVFRFEAVNPVRSAAFLFTLDGRYHAENRIKVMTARICRRNVEEEEHISSRYSKRDIELSEFKWYPNGKPFTYSIVNGSSLLGEELSRKEITRAVETYSKQTNFDFRELKLDEADGAQIAFMFIAGAHADGKAFEGSGYVKAHAFFPVHGEIHFNDNENWAVHDEATADGEKVSLYYVALHELGHAFGLGHSDLKVVMANGYNSETAIEIEELQEEDVDALEEQYPLEAKDGGGQTVTLPANEVQYDNKEVLAYKPRIPVPKDCICNIEAAFTLHTETDQSKYMRNKVYLISQGYLWRYRVSKLYSTTTHNKKEAGYPKRLAEEFPKALGNVDAALHTGYGGMVYIIMSATTTKPATVLKYSYYASYDAYVFLSNMTLNETFGIPDNEVITSAFNHKVSQCSSNKRSCVSATLIAGPNTRYEVEFAKKGTVLKKKTVKKTDGANVIGEVFPNTQFRAAFELDDGQVAQFDSSRVMRIREHYPKVYKESRADYEVSDWFDIDGWCNEIQIKEQCEAS